MGGIELTGDFSIAFAQRPAHSGLGFFDLGGREMRHLTIALALAFAFGGASVAQACSFMNAGKSTPSTIASDDGPSSTKILIPAPTKPETKG